MQCMYIAKSKNTSTCRITVMHCACWHAFTSYNLYCLKLVSWTNVPFQHKYDYVRDKRSGVKSYPYPVTEGQQYINLKPGRHFVQQPPERERDREAHLNYYASDYNRGRQLSHRKTKLNQIQQNMRINLN